MMQSHGLSPLPYRQQSGGFVWVDPAPYPGRPLGDPVRLSFWLGITPSSVPGGHPRAPPRQSRPGAGQSNPAGQRDLDAGRFCAGIGAWNILPRVQDGVRVGVTVRPCDLDRQQSSPCKSGVEARIHAPDENQVRVVAMPRGGFRDRRAVCVSLGNDLPLDLFRPLPPRPPHHPHPL